MNKTRQAVETVNFWLYFKLIIRQNKTQYFTYIIYTEQILRNFFFLYFLKFSAGRSLNFKLIWIRFFSFSRGRHSAYVIIFQPKLHVVTRGVSKQTFKFFPL